MEKLKLVLGTRKSKLALVQTALVVDEINKKYPEVDCILKPQSTMGDKVLDRPLVSFGGKGVFIEEFERDIVNGVIDLAVHSAKDMPTKLLDNLEIAAVLPREDARDVLVWRKDVDFDKIKTPIVGTGSKRRMVQVKEIYPSCECKALRGNVTTRLEKLENGEYDAIILAVAGLKRLGLFDEGKFSYRYFDISEMIPSGGQGIIAVEALDNKGKVHNILSGISDKTTYYRLLVERFVLEGMNAGCHEPIGVYSEFCDNRWTIHFMDGRSGKAIYYTDYVDVALEDLHNNAILEKGYALAKKLLDKVRG